MPRKRTPSPELQQSDRDTIDACTGIVQAIAQRYPDSDALRAGVRCLREFAMKPVHTPQPRSRKPKVEARSQVEIIIPRDGKSAAANDDMHELTHHSV
jgi:hypothetical protein